MQRCFCSSCRCKLRQAERMGLQWAAQALDDLRERIRTMPLSTKRPTAKESK